MSGRVRIALVGLGDIGVGAHLPALLASSDVQVVAVADPDPARRDAALAAGAGEARAVAVDGLDAALTTGAGVDAVVLATSPWVTTGLAETALRAGRFVLAEKPVATSVAAAAPLRALAAEQVARLQVGLTYRHDPAIERLRDWIAEGRLGDPLLVRAHVYDERRDPADPGHAGRVAAALRHGSPLLHDGAHLFDWLIVLLGGVPAEVADAWALRTDPGAPKPHLTGARLRWANGTTALAEVGWWLPRLPRCELEVLGDRGRALLNLRSFELRGWFGAGAGGGDAGAAGGGAGAAGGGAGAAGGGAGAAGAAGGGAGTEPELVRFPGERMERCFARQLERFAQLCRGERAASPGLEDGLASLGLSERIEAAAGIRAATEATDATEVAR